MPRIVHVVGARPNFMKAAPVLAALNALAEPPERVLVHTGQHYDANMSREFFEDLSLPEPDVHLDIGGFLGHAEQTGRIMTALEKVCIERRPDLMCVIGDVNSTLAGALVAAKLHIPLAHVESGLRSLDRTMPEEVNRVVTDVLADILFAPSMLARENLLREGIQPQRIHVSGNVMVDSLLQHREKAERTSALQRLGLEGRQYVLVTLHRAGNVDDRETLGRLADALSQVAEKALLVFPVHPRARKRLEEFGLEEFGLGDRFLFHEAPSGQARDGAVNCYPPLRYLEFLGLVMHAALVLTDSGGLQVETSALDVPCLTLREQTEWTETLTHGTNTLLGSDPGAIVEAASKVLAGERKRAKGFEGWDGQAARRMAQVLSEFLAGRG